MIGRMTARYVHTCLRVRDPEASLAFYRRLGFEPRGRLNFATAHNLYLGLPGGGDVLELTVNQDRTEPYELGDGYNHIALVVEDLAALLDGLAAAGIEPEKPPFHPGDRDELPLICFIAGPRRLPRRADRPRLSHAAGPGALSAARARAGGGLQTATPRAAGARGGARRGSSP